MKELKELALAKKVLEDHKAEDVAVVDVEGFSPFSSYYVLASATNIRHLGALSESLEEEFEKSGFADIKKDGNPESGWMIVEAGEIVVHLFLDVNRKEIDLEGLLQKEVTSKRA